MLANAKQFVPPTNKAHGPQINAKNTGMVGEEKEKKKKKWENKSIKGNSARNVCGSR